MGRVARNDENWTVDTVKNMLCKLSPTARPRDLTVAGFDGKSAQRLVQIDAIKAHL